MKRGPAMTLLRCVLSALVAASAGIWITSYTRPWHLKNFPARSPFAEQGVVGVIEIGGGSPQPRPDPPASVATAIARERLAVVDLREMIDLLGAARSATFPRWVSNGSGWGLLIPMWIPTVALGSLALWSWWPAGFGPGRCRKCGYDVNGLPAAAPCPECGTAAKT